MCKKAEKMESSSHISELNNHFSFTNAKYHPNLRSHDSAFLLPQVYIRLLYMRNSENIPCRALTFSLIPHQVSEPTEVRIKAKHCQKRRKDC